MNAIKMFSTIMFIIGILIVLSNTHRRYEFIIVPKTWDAANTYCRTQFGTELATIGNPEDNNRAANLCGDISCWIGFHDRETEGIFVWVDGTAVSFTNFAYYGNKDCTEIKSGFYGHWNVVRCTSLRAFLCNAPSPLLFNNIQSSLQFNEFRTFDGTNNNLNNPLFGIHNGPIIRNTPVGFENGVDSRARPNEKSARIISNIVSSSDEADTLSSDVGLSNLAWLFGQFIDHDLVEQTASMEDIPQTRIDETEICIPIPVNDPFFRDVSQECITIVDNAKFSETDIVQRTQNIATSYIDGSVIYGSEPDRHTFFKNNDGSIQVSLNTNNDINLPFNTFGLDNSGGSERTDLYLAGEPRVNENIALTAMHTIWHRNHNYLWNEIRNANPFLTPDELFEYARAVNSAQLQHVLYTEWLPAFFGRYNFDEFIDTNTPYDSTCDASIAAHFSFVAFRVGHTLISQDLPIQDSLCTGTDSVNLLDAFTKPSIIDNGERVVDKLLMGLSCTDARYVDPFIIEELRNLLQFGVNNNTDPMDLMAINIERGRDDGIADYVTLRSAFGLQKPTSFYDISSLFINSDIKNRLQTAYHNNINNIDPIVGAFSEHHITDAAFGPLIAYQWAEQFQRLINCDRFYYKRYLKDGLKKYVESTTMRTIIQQNSNPRIEFRPDHQFVFNVPGKGLNADISFISIKNVGSGFCLKVLHNININGNLVIQYKCSNTDAQKWYYNTKSKEIIHIAGKCLSVVQRDFDERIKGGDIVIHDCNGQASQKWIIDENYSNRYIRNFLGMCLELDPNKIFVLGGRVQVSQCNPMGQVNQKWLYFGEKLHLHNRNIF